MGKKSRGAASLLYSFLENDDPTVKDNRQFKATTTLEYWFDPNSGFDTQLAYTRGKFDNDTQAAENREASDDFKNWSGYIKFFRRLSQNFFLVGKYDHIFRDYDDNSSDNAQADYQVYHPTVGFSYVYKELLNMNLAFGYAYQDEDGGEDSEGMTVDASAVANLPFKRGEGQSARRVRNRSE